MAKTVTLRIDEQTYKFFKKQAAAENRSLANFIETAAKAYTEEANFADEFEMAEIMSNDALLERLRKGSRDAKRKKGVLIG